MMLIKAYKKALYLSAIQRIASSAFEAQVWPGGLSRGKQHRSLRVKARLVPVFIFRFSTPVPDRVFQLEPGE